MKSILVLLMVIFFSTLSYSQKLTIIRSLECDSSILGYLYVDDKPICYTLELPWRDNIGDISCIPKGLYNGNIRFDHKDKWRVQLLNVPNRSNVQIHIGNYPSNVLGCILVGAGVETNKCIVVKSAEAYDNLKKKYEESVLTDGANLTIEIK